VPDIRSEMLDFKHNGSDAQGYLARPDGEGPCPGVIVIQEWWGLNENIKDIANRFAGEGFVAFAPDLYHGDVAANHEPDKAQKKMMQLEMPLAVKELVAATEHLDSLPYIAGKGIGATGFCMGGGLATMLACSTPLIRAVVPFYGAPPEPIDAVQNLQGPVLLVYADHDDWVNAAVRDRMQQALSEHGKQFEIKTYPNTEHGFFNDTRPEAYNAEAAKDAWQRMLDLFRKNL
jgi:carboxymethylenebutenolidase